MQKYYSMTISIWFYCKGTINIWFWKYDDKMRDRYDVIKYVLMNINDNETLSYSEIW